MSDKIISIVGDEGVIDRVIELTNPQQRAEILIDGIKSGVYDFGEHESRRVRIADIDGYELIEKLTPRERYIILLDWLWDITGIEGVDV